MPVRVFPEKTFQDRIFDIIYENSTKHADKDWDFMEKGGQDVDLVFSAVDGNLENIRVPYLYTYQGFKTDFLTQLVSSIEQLKEENQLLKVILPKDQK